MKQDYMKQLLLFLLPLFFITNINAQDAKLDSLRQLLTSLPNDTTKLKVYTEYTNELCSTNLVEAKKTGIAGVEFSKQFKNDNLSAYMQLALGKAYQGEARIDSAQHHFLLAKELFDKIGSLKGKVAVLEKLRYVTRQRNQHHETIRLALQAIKIYEYFGDYSKIAQAYSDISDADYGLDKYDESILYNKKALDILQEHNLMHEAPYTLDGLAHTYVFLEEYDKALDYSDQALAIVKTLNDENKMASTLSVRANLLKNMGRFEESTDAYKIVLAHATNIGSLGWQAHTLNKMGDLHNRAAQYDKALEALLKCKAILEKLGESKYYGDHYSFLARAYAGLGQLDSAYHYKSLEGEYNLKVYTEESNVISTQLKTEFETEKKEATIAQQKSELALKNTQQKYLMGIGGMLLLLLGGAFYAFRAKQKSNQALEEKNKEINMLFGEVHHRVKNNLQILSSLLHLQSRHITDDAALSAVKEGQNRVEAMGLIHQKLYTKDNASTIEISDYLNELGESLTDSLMRHGQVEIFYDTPHLFLDVDTAIPLGLIVNELITNSLKYGFPDDRKGKIQVKLDIDAHKNLNLTVADNGVGKLSPKDFAIESKSKKSTHFGTQLIRILCKKLKGKIVIAEQEVGYSTQISFSKWK